MNTQPRERARKKEKDRKKREKREMQTARPVHDFSERNKERENGKNRERIERGSARKGGYQGKRPVLSLVGTVSTQYVCWCMYWCVRAYKCVRLRM